MTVTHVSQNHLVISSLNLLIYLLGTHLTYIGSNWPGLNICLNLFPVCVTGPKIRILNADPDPGGQNKIIRNQLYAFGYLFWHP